MFKLIPRVIRTSLFLGLALFGCLAWLGIALLRGHRPGAIAPAKSTSIAVSRGRNGDENASARFEGDQAHEFLQQTSTGQSLMQAVNATRFSLQRQGDGYLGMNPEQQLDARFDQAGVNLWSTVARTDGEQAWQLGLRLKTFGYGVDTQPAPPIVSHKAQGNRIEYVRRADDTGKRNEDSSVSATEILREPQTASDKPPLVEWYENGATGIEQGFTLNTRPTRGPEIDVAEPLRLVVELSGGLRARAIDAGSEVELLDECDERVLRYGKLTAVDASGRELTARMEVAANEQEIALVVVDDNAQFPIVVDPLVWQDQAPISGDAAFQRAGYSVAISGNTAIVGTCKGLETQGKAYVFVRESPAWTQETTWEHKATLTGDAQSTPLFGCSVAISSSKSFGK